MVWIHFVSKTIPHIPASPRGPFNSLLCQASDKGFCNFQGNNEGLSKTTIHKHWGFEVDQHVVVGSQVPQLTKIRGQGAWLGSGFRHLVHSTKNSIKSLTQRQRQSQVFFNLMLIEFPLCTGQSMWSQQQGGSRIHQVYQYSQSKYSLSPPANHTELQQEAV